MPATGKRPFARNARTSLGFCSTSTTDENAGAHFSATIGDPSNSSTVALQDAAAAASEEIEEVAASLPFGMLHRGGDGLQIAPDCLELLLRPATRNASGMTVLAIS